mgnify:CR=1 FL=1
MKIKIYKSLAMCTLLLGLAACNDFEEMNTDPYAPVYDPEIIGATPDGIDIDYELTPSAKAFKARKAPSVRCSPT